MKLNHIFTNEITPDKLFHIPEQPVNVMLDVTDYCNNRCKFCYNPEAKDNRKDIHRLPRLEKIVSTIGESGTKEILYLGGEPFAEEAIDKLLAIGSKHGMFQRAVSNGSFFRDVKRCSQLKEMGLNEVGISFHSSSPEIHDHIAGRKGSFRDAEVGVTNCIKAGINVFAQYSPNTLNSATDILALAALLKELSGGKVSFFDINRMLPLGMGRTADELFLQVDEWFNFLLTASKLEDYGYNVHAELTPFCWLNNMARKHSVAPERLKMMHRQNRGCFMWIAQLPLDQYGRIKFCPAGPPVGPSILEVEWPEFWRNWDVFKSYRSFLWNNNCVEFGTSAVCEYFYKCLGGCKYSSGNHIQVDKYSQGMVTITNAMR